MIKINTTTKELTNIIKDYNLQQDPSCSSLYINDNLVLSCNSDHCGMVYVFVNQALFNKIEINLKIIEINS